MEQKRVSFKVAKAIKKAGFQQEANSAHYVDYEDYSCFNNWSEPECAKWTNLFAAPTYLEVWLWLWRNKGIEILPTGGIIYHGGKLGTKNLYNYPNDPEESIIAAIDCLVENDLIK